jgi:hypothetical protein
MKKRWFEVKTELLDEIRNAVERDQPDLRVIVTDEGRVLLRGSFAVRDATAVLDRYQIEIRFPEDYPDSLPVLEEIGDRIPKTADRHTNVDGAACLLVPEEWFVISPDRSFAAFLGGPVKNFFLGQILVQGGQPWPFGERPHGYEGILECYLEILGIQDANQVRPYLDCLRKERLRGHWDCPCGSSKRLRYCHLDQFRQLQKRLPHRIAQQAYDRLRAYSRRSKS